MPNISIALKFAKNPPLSAGKPAPSLSWSLFSNNALDAETELRKDRIMTIVIERLDESLVVTSHYMGWSLADIIVIKDRKASSPHPKWNDWPSESIAIMNATLKRLGEYAVYNVANEKLNERLQTLAKQGVSVKGQLVLLQELRRRVTTVRDK